MQDFPSACPAGPIMKKLGYHVIVAAMILLYASISLTGCYKSVPEQDSEQILIESKSFTYEKISYSYENPTYTVEEPTVDYRTTFMTRVIWLFVS
jgi:hypothetical protein